MRHVVDHCDCFIILQMQNNAVEMEMVLDLDHWNKEALQRFSDTSSVM